MQTKRELIKVPNFMYKLLIEMSPATLTASFTFICINDGQEKWKIIFDFGPQKPFFNFNYH